MSLVAERPGKGEDVRHLWKNVRELVEGTNALLNMKAIFVEGRAKGLGVLRLQGNKAVIQIYAGQGEDIGGQDVYITTPTVTVVSSQNPANQGTTIHWTAILSAPNATGTVQFRIDGVNFGGPVNLVNGVAQSANNNTLATGNHTILALYSGDALHNPSSGSTVQHIGGRTDLTITSSEDPARPSFPMHWDVRIHPHTPGPLPTGWVDIDIDGVHFDSKQSAAIGGGDAGITTSNKTWTAGQAGHHNIHAHYRGDQNYAEAEEDYDQFVLHVRGMTLTVSPIPGVEGQVETFQVHFDREGNHNPTGLCQLWLSTNGQPFTAFGGTFPLIDGERTLGATMAPGHYALFVAFAGDAFYVPVNSNTVVFDIVSIPQGAVTLSPTPQIIFPEGGVRFIWNVNLDSGQSGPFKIGVLQNPIQTQYGSYLYFYLNNQPCPVGFNLPPSIVANFVNGHSACDVAALLTAPWGGVPNQLIASNGMMITRSDGTLFTSLQGIPNQEVASDYFAVMSR